MYNSTLEHDVIYEISSSCVIDSILYRKRKQDPSIILIYQLISETICLMTICFQYIRLNDHCMSLDFQVCRQYMANVECCSNSISDLSLQDLSTYSGMKHACSYSGRVSEQCRADR